MRNTMKGFVRSLMIYFINIFLIRQKGGNTTILFIQFKFINTTFFQK